MEATHKIAADIAQKAKALPGVSDVLVPQDVDYPALQLDIDRLRTAELGLNEKEVVGDVITALTSDQMIAPSYWVDPKSGNDYFLTVQYPEGFIKNFADLSSIPVRGANSAHPTRLDTLSAISHRTSPTEVDHYQLRREMDVYVSPTGEDLGKVLKGVQKIVADLKLPSNVRIVVRGSAHAMQVSFRSFGLGLILATVLVYLILVAQFKSFLDPLLILLAVPTGLTGVLIILFATGTTLNVMSLMGIVMMVGIVGLEQHSHRRIHQPSARGRPAVARSRFARLPRAFASGADDFARHVDGLDSDGAETRHGQRSLRAARPRHHRRTCGFGGADRFHRADGIFHPLSPERNRDEKFSRTQRRRFRIKQFPNETNYF